MGLPLFRDIGFEPPDSSPRLSPAPPAAAAAPRFLVSYPLSSHAA